VRSLQSKIQDLLYQEVSSQRQSTIFFPLLNLQYAKSLMHRQRVVDDHGCDRVLRLLRQKDGQSNRVKPKTNRHNTSLFFRRSK
jgi:hypothetical protein